MKFSFKKKCLLINLSEGISSHYLYEPKLDSTISYFHRCHYRSMRRLLFYSHRIYGYVCDQEKNIPGCFLAGRYYWERGDQSIAFQYFRKSRHKDYLKGCDLSSEFIENQSDRDQVIRLRNSYCKSGFEQYCSNCR